MKATFAAYFQSTVDTLYQKDAGREKLLAACHYAVTGPGKRVRPLLLLPCNQVLGGRVEDALDAAVAVELLHSYSLIHDDLPLMDNDDWRRGRATTHRVFGEVHALLAGDALLTDSFRLLTQGLHPDNKLPDARRVQMVAELAQSCGSRGMVLGQSQDMQTQEMADPTIQDLEEMHSLKTGELLAASCAIGALSATTSTEEDITRLGQFGAKLGLAFQILDDLLDDQAGTGKSKGKDLSQGKLTFLSHWSAADARKRAEQLSAEAKALLQIYGEMAKPLEEFVDLLRVRTQ